MNVRLVTTHVLENTCVVRKRFGEVGRRAGAFMAFIQRIRIERKRS